MSTQLYAQNTNPTVSSIAFSISGTTVTVIYDVADAEQNTVTIGMQVSSDNGATWNFNFGSANGDIGTGVSIGNSKTITWNYSAGYNPNFMITHNNKFCKITENWIKKLITKSDSLALGSEKVRKRYFNILYAKLDRLRAELNIRMVL